MIRHEHRQVQHHTQALHVLAALEQEGKALQLWHVVVNDQGTFVDGAKFISGDYTADNGVVHVLDSVLAPQGLPTQHVWGWIAESEEHSSCVCSGRGLMFQPVLLSPSE